MNRTFKIRFTIPLLAILHLGIAKAQTPLTGVFEYVSAQLDPASEDVILVFKDEKNSVKNFHHTKGDKNGAENLFLKPVIQPGLNDLNLTRPELVGKKISVKFIALGNTQLNSNCCFKIIEILSPEKKFRDQ